jgi:GNAT superfamily N-acetyltransferase
MPPRLRPAQPSDLDAIAVFTSATFEWGDYVADRFLDWLDDEGALTVVAVDPDDVPIGVSRVVMLSQREAWLHGARVHPDHRREGIGVAMNDYACAWATERGAVVARLLVEDWNEPARRQVERLGYRSVTEWASATLELGSEVLPITNGGRRVPGEERLTPARTTETDIAWMAWMSGEMARSARELFPIGWHFRHMTVTDLSEAAKRRTLWQCPSGWLIAESEPDGRLWVPWISTSDLDAARLVRALIDLGEGLRVESVRVMIPRLGWFVEALERGGFAVSPSTIYAKTLV